MNVVSYAEIQYMYYIRVHFKLLNICQYVSYVSFPFALWLLLTQLFTSNGGLLELIELALDEAQDQAGLAYCHVSQQNQLKLADLGLGQVPVGPGIPTGGHGAEGVVGMWGGMGVLLSSLSKHSKSKRWTRITSGVFLQPQILKQTKTKKREIETSECQC